MVATAIWKSKKLGDLLTLGNGLLLIVLINLVASLYFFRIDLTEERRYSIKPATKEMLRELDDVVYVEVFLEGDLNAEFKRLRNAIRETLEEFRIYSGNNVQYKFTNPTSALSQKAQNEYLQELVAKGIQVLPVVETHEGEQVKKFIMPGALVSYGGDEQGVMLFRTNITEKSQEVVNQSIEGLEYELARTITQLMAADRKVVTFLTGHGEADSLSLASIRDELSKQYDVVSKNLREVDSVSGEVVILAKPTRAFSEIDKLKLDQYLMRGGNLVFFIDAMHASMDSASFENNFAFPYEINLQDQLFKYGVRVNPDLIQDRFSSSYPVVVSVTDNKPQIMQMEWPFYPMIYQHTEHPISRNMDASLTRFISSIDSVRADGVRKTPLFFSSQYSRKLTAPVKISVNDLRKNVDPQSFNEGPSAVAWLLEGDFNSLYKNRFLPEGISKDGYLDHGRGKVIVVGDGDFILNDVNPRNGLPQELGMDPISGRVFANQPVVMNMIAYLTDQNGLITARNKEVLARPLDKERVKNERVKWQVINIGAPLVLIIIAGIVLSWARRKKYARF